MSVVQRLVYMIWVDFYQTGCWFRMSALLSVHNVSRLQVFKKIRREGYAPLPQSESLECFANESTRSAWQKYANGFAAGLLSFARLLAVLTSALTTGTILELYWVPCISTCIFLAIHFRDISKLTIAFEENFGSYHHSRILPYWEKKICIYIVKRKMSYISI